MRRLGTFARFYNTGGTGSAMPPAEPPVTPVEPPEPREPARTRNVTCDGCGSLLDSKGQIITRGEGIRAHIAREDEVTRLTKELDGANQKVTELEARIAELTPAKKRSIFL